MPTTVSTGRKGNNQQQHRIPSNFEQPKRQNEENKKKKIEGNSEKEEIRRKPERDLREGM